MSLILQKVWGVFFHSLYHEMSRTEEMIELQIYFFHFRKVINYNAIGTQSLGF